MPATAEPKIHHIVHVDRPPSIFKFEDVKIIIFEPGGGTPDEWANRSSDVPVAM